MIVEIIIQYVVTMGYFELYFDFEPVYILLLIAVLIYQQVSLTVSEVIYLRHST
jgi:hypothetical protein